VIEIDSQEKLIDLFASEQYFLDKGLATALFLANKLGNPILLEGEPGVGKTEIAKVFAKIYGLELIRLQCYEGLDVHSALYDWNYARQLLSIKIQDANQKNVLEEDLYSDKFLLARPLLKAIQGSERKVLLIDEIDRSDVSFEAFLLELLSDFQVTIPEIGTIKAQKKPIVVITSNQTREVHDALKRRCLYHWIEFPSYEKEMKILTNRFPNIDNEILTRAVKIIQYLRSLELEKKPGIAESISWMEGFLAIGDNKITSEYIDNSLGLIIKSKNDYSVVKAKLPKFVENLN
jgi:MoxR-like ATPase